MTFALKNQNFSAERKMVLKKFNKGIRQFCGLGTRATFVCQTDPVDTPLLSAADKSSVPVWATGGRIQLSIENYAECISVAHPHAYQAPTDNETSLPSAKTSGRKRCGNSVLRTKTYLELLSAYRERNVELSKIPVFLSPGGGNDPEWRLTAVEETDFSIASGIVLDGFFHSGHEESTDGQIADKNNSSLFSLLLAVCKKLPPDLPRFLTGVWQPPDIVLATKCGVDVFDGSLPYRLTRSALAWIYPGWDACNTSDTNNATRVCAHRPYIAFPFDDSAADSTAVLYTTPIQSGCTCFACQRHTQGYISHLHIAGEMLGPMLLMIHNSHLYYRFFEDLRLAARTNRLDEFFRFVEPLRFPRELLAVDKTNESKSASVSSLNGTT
ncbi:hypothetical protein CRM22_001312 [Opisthorchis felineus]|uniref:tRNA-guanine(15) transglycosylase-like domain-containing protein n=1 Tax=Opisthorchis felineus TaxID=147828 RepID=A0A4S2MFG3_OPIFE|nr:hypothetical protein CRM22_001312 [Opisthorchis felineus]